MTGVCRAYDGKTLGNNGKKMTKKNNNGSREISNDKQLLSSIYVICYEHWLMFLQHRWTADDKMDTIDDR